MWPLRSSCRMVRLETHLLGWLECQNSVLLTSPLVHDKDSQGLPSAKYRRLEAIMTKTIG